MNFEVGGKANRLREICPSGLVTFIRIGEAEAQISRLILQIELA